MTKTTSTTTSLETAVRQGLDTTEPNMLESSLFRGILDREKAAAETEIALLNGKLDALTFRKTDLERIVRSADAALGNLEVTNGQQ